MSRYGSDPIAKGFTLMSHEFAFNSACIAYGFIAIDPKVKEPTQPGCMKAGPCRHTMVRVSL